MFKVRDSKAYRENKIRGFIATEPGLAVLMASAHFEWVVKRTILKVGHAPTRPLRQQLGAVYGLDRYKDAWREQVQHRPGVGLAGTVQNWSQVYDAFKLRGALVHGAGSTSARFAKRHVDVLLQAAEDVEAAARKCRVQLYRRLRARRS